MRVSDADTPVALIPIALPIQAYVQPRRRSSTDHPVPLCCRDWNAMEVVPRRAEP